MLKLELTSEEAALLIKAGLYGLKGPQPVASLAPTAKKLAKKLLELYKLVVQAREVNRTQNVAPRASSNQIEAIGREEPSLFG